MEDGGCFLQVHIRVTGTVQGVGYRYWAFRNADSLSLGGHVRNLSDGSVEAVFCGEASAAEEMLRRCEKGPSFSYVRELKVLRRETVAECPGEFSVHR